MKAMLLILAGGIFLWFYYMMSVKNGQTKTTLSSIEITDSVIDFKTQVQPILQKNCSPCHFPGGKLYEKLPFDKGETILNHQAGVLKRIKNEEEAKRISDYVARNKTWTKNRHGKTKNREQVLY